MWWCEDALKKEIIKLYKSENGRLSNVRKFIFSTMLIIDSIFVTARGNEEKCYVSMFRCYLLCLRQDVGDGKNAQPEHTCYIFWCFFDRAS